MAAEKVLTVRCRARVSPNCYHGRSEAGIYPDGADDDGTWRESDGTVVCDPCYIGLGQPSGRSRQEARKALDDAVRAAQGGQRRP